MYVSIHVHVYMHTYTYIYVYIYNETQMYTYTRIFIYRCIILFSSFKLTTPWLRDRVASTRSAGSLYPILIYLTDTLLARTLFLWTAVTIENPVRNLQTRRHVDSRVPTAFVLRKSKTTTRGYADPSNEWSSRNNDPRVLRSRFQQHRRSRYAWSFDIVK